MLEVGPATGKATRPLAERGLRVTCVELGPMLAERARSAFAGRPGVEIVQAAFEEWRRRPVSGSTWSLRFRRPGELAVETAEIAESGLFDAVSVGHYDWEVVYDADGYIDLLETFSGHIAMQPWQCERLYGEIRRRVNERPDGLLRRHWGAVLHVARRRDS